jgi:alpha-galactosidase
MANFQRNKAAENQYCVTGILFISVKREAVNADQEKELTEALRKAAKPQEIGEPLDWMEKRLPTKWRLGGQPVEFQW